MRYVYVLTVVARSSTNFIAYTMQEARLHYLVFDEVVGSSVSAVAASAHQTKSRTAASSTLFLDTGCSGLVLDNYKGLRGGKVGAWFARGKDIEIG